MGGSNVVKCWGENEHGQLGYGDTTLRSSSDKMGNYLPSVAFHDGAALS